jgi:hypothetical protein
MFFETHGGGYRTQRFKASNRPPPMMLAQHLGLIGWISADQKSFSASGRNFVHGGCHCPTLAGNWRKRAM